MIPKLSVLKRRWRELLRFNSSPEEIALGTAIGVFIAITPLYGLHTVMVVCAAFLVKRANKIAMFLGTNISNILTLPFITWAGYMIGRSVLKGYPELTMEAVRNFNRESFLRFYYPLLVGSLIMGAVMAGVVYLIILMIFKARVRRRGIPCVRFSAWLIAAVLVLGRVVAASAAVSPGEVIRYSVSPVGRAEYHDHGLVATNNGERWLVTFNSRAAGFKDEEKIYSDPGDLLPVRVERFVSFMFRKERLVEEYADGGRLLVITKFVGKKKVKTYVFKSDGSFHNAITLPFCLRSVPELAIGWSFVARIPRRFTVTLVSIDTVKVSGGRYRAFHFRSSPGKFHIWISADDDRIPLKIKGLGGQSLVMKDRWKIPENDSQEKERQK